MLTTNGIDDAVRPEPVQGLVQKIPRNELQSVMALPPDPSQNLLLASLSQADRERLSEHLGLVPMRLGEMLHETGERVQYAYFPTTSVASLHHVMASGASSEFAGVGHEGMVGVGLFMGGDIATNSAIVQTAGHAYRLRKDLLRQEFDRGGLLQRLLLRYTHALSTQIGVSTVCGRFHSVEQQLCRWLLLTLDRLPTTELVMTQELVANILGVRRESITQAAGKLQNAGFIQYRRGHISVLDRSGLETRSCECYAMIRNELNLLLADAQRLHDRFGGITRV